jgi:hypothetical protein
MRHLRWAMRSATGTVLATAIVTCGAGPTVQTGDDGIDVLFVGNSLTFQNDMPGILKALLDSAGLESRIESFAPGGWGLQDHWVSGRSRELIANGGWDVVILQQGPSATEGRPSLLEYTPLFAGEARAVGAEIGLYMVWPAEERLFDFQGVSDSYRMAAESVDGLLFPVGEAWRAAWRRDPDFDLYGEDRFHPSPAASYLAALVFFEQLTGQSPVGLPAVIDFELVFTEDIVLTREEALLLQQAASEANREFARTPG